jgi:hypothetical protein
MTVKTTLASQVSIAQPDGQHVERDVVIVIDELPRIRTGLRFSIGPNKHIVITLNEAERKSMAEALTR